MGNRQCFEKVLKVGGLIHVLLAAEPGDGEGQLLRIALPGRLQLGRFPGQGDEGSSVVSRALHADEVYSAVGGGAQDDLFFLERLMRLEQGGGGEAWAIIADGDDFFKAFGIDGFQGIGQSFSKGTACLFGAVAGENGELGLARNGEALADEALGNGCIAFLSQLWGEGLCACFLKRMA